ncbi:hypothetical protein C8R45DRAFT_1115595 [Mycena sanguinolenta]|nr:hypothetical protein C8R45DRAFT_1115595 [Mycena sanguinolenta]
MPCGRPRLAPEVKQEHVLRSRKQYEEKNVEKRREAARLRMQRKRAEIEDDLRLKKDKQEWAEYKATQGEKRRARKVEADNLRRKHQAMVLQDQEPAGAISTPAPVRQKAQLFHASPTRSKEPRRSPLARSVPSTARHTAPPPCVPLPCTHSPHRLTDITQGDDKSDSKSNSPTRARHSPPPVFEQRVVRNVQRCLHCFQEGCPGCACMCDDSLVWIVHNGGHFFPTCKKCGEDDCPGCACVCRKATDLIEHGGHIH